MRAKYKFSFINVIGRTVGDSRIGVCFDFPAPHFMCIFFCALCLSPAKLKNVFARPVCASSVRLFACAKFCATPGSLISAMRPLEERVLPYNK